MARFNFGGSLTDFAITSPSARANAVFAQPNATGSVYAARTGGSALTDLLDSSGNPTTTVGTDANGFLNRFQGPDGYAELWVDLGGGSRFFIRTADGVATNPKSGRNALTGWFHISGYSGADPTGATSSQTAVAAAFADAAAYAGATMNSLVSAGATVYVDGQYLLTAPIAYPTKVRTVGNGRDTARLFNNTTDLFAWGTGSMVYRAVFEHVALETGPTGGHVINYSGDMTGGLVRSRFFDATLRTRNTASSLVKWAGTGQFIGNVFDQCDLDAQASRTVPAFDMSVTAGNLINSNVWQNSWCEGHSTTAAPFFKIQTTGSGAYLYNNSFRDLVGEQNGGGFIHLYGCDGVVVENCPDWDLAGAYQDHVYKFGAVASNPCRNVIIRNSYRLSNAGGLGSGVRDIYAVANAPSTATHATIRIENCDPPGAQVTTTLNGSASITGLTAAYKVVTGTYTVTDTDPDVIVCNSGTAFTLTLPAAASAKNGRRVTVKNVGAGTVTVSPVADGATVTLAQWAKNTFMTDGENAALGRIWFTV